MGGGSLSIEPTRGLCQLQLRNQWTWLLGEQGMKRMLCIRDCPLLGNVGDQHTMANCRVAIKILGPSTQIMQLTSSHSFD